MEETSLELGESGKGGRLITLLCVTIGIIEIKEEEKEEEEDAFEC